MLPISKEHPLPACPIRKEHPLPACPIRKERGWGRGEVVLGYMVLSAVFSVLLPGRSTATAVMVRRVPAAWVVWAE